MCLRAICASIAGPKPDIFEGQIARCGPGSTARLKRPDSRTAAERVCQPTATGCHNRLEKRFVRLGVSDGIGRHCSAVVEGSLLGLACAYDRGGGVLVDAVRH